MRAGLCSIGRGVSENSGMSILPPFLPSFLLPFFTSKTPSDSYQWYWYRQEISTRQTIITLFLARFTLTPDEAEAIASREVPVGPRFFAAMDKAERVRDDCRVLMAGEDGPTKAG